MIAFCLVNSKHGTLIVNRFDQNEAFNGGMYGVGAQILQNGSYDLGEIETLKQLLPLRRKYYGDGVVVLDGGANIGVHTVEFAKFMEGWGGVIAVEAQERIFYSLAGNLNTNNCLNARAVWGALDSKNGHIDIPEPDYTKQSSFGSFELRDRLGVENIGQEIDYDKATLRVATMAIDSFELPRLDLLKLDVEGMELEAIEGGKETIKRCKPLIYAEVVKTDRKVLTETLEGLGYKVFPHGMNVLAIHESDKTLTHIQTERKS